MLRRRRSEPCANRRPSARHIGYRDGGDRPPTARGRGSIFVVQHQATSRLQSHLAALLQAVRRCGGPLWKVGDEAPGTYR